MTYTNTPAVVSQQTTSYSSGNIPYTSIALLENIPHSAQLEVERIFVVDRDGSAATLLAFLADTAVTTAQKKAVFIIPISRCTLNTATKNISAINLPASGDVYNYVITTPTPTTYTIKVPILSSSTVTVRRKTVSNEPLVNWVAGSRLTSKQLNLATTQSLYLLQEAIEKIGTSLTLAATQITVVSLADAAVTPSKISTTTDPWSFYGTIQTVAPTANLHATTRLYTLDKFFQHGVMTKDDVAPTSSAVDILETAATAGNSGLWFNPKNGTINLWAGNAWVTVAGTPVTTANLVTTNTVQTVTAAKTFAAGTVVPFTQTGTGAVARTVDAKLKDTVSVKDFGAVGDGVADDTVAIQATITAVGIAGGCVYFPKGTYKITSQLVIYDSNIRLVGDGFKNTTIAASSASFNMMRTTNGKSFISISDLSFLGGATTNATAQYGIIGGTTATDETSNVLIENCRFSNSNNGMVLCSGKYWKVNNCYFDTLIGDISGTGYGILSAENSAYGLFTNNQFTGTAGNGRHAVYMSVGCSYSIASNNIVKGFNHSAFVCYATSAQAGVVENIISGNVITGGGSVAIQEDAAIYLGGKASSCLVSNNTILNFANIGIVVVDLGYGMLFNSMIKGNLITTCSLQGIAVKGAATTSILSNYVNGCSTSSSGTYAGIYISSFNSGGASTLTNTFISNNVVFGTTHKASFEINASVPLPTNTFVVGNIFTDGATAGRPVILNEATPIVSNYISNSTTGLYNYGGNEISRFVSRSSALNFGSIAANTTLELTLAVSANVTTTNWSVVVTPETGMESGLVWCAYVSAANTVTIRVANVTVAAIDPASKTFIVDCYRHNS